MNSTPIRPLISIVTSDHELGTDLTTGLSGLDDTLGSVSISEVHPRNYANRRVLVVLDMRDNSARGLALIRQLKGDQSTREWAIIASILTSITKSCYSNA